MDNTQATLAKTHKILTIWTNQKKTWISINPKILAITITFFIVSAGSVLTFSGFNLIGQTIVYKASNFISLPQYEQALKDRKYTAEIISTPEGKFGIKLKEKKYLDLEKRYKVANSQISVYENQNGIDYDNVAASLNLVLIVSAFLTAFILYLLVKEFEDFTLSLQDSIAKRYPYQEKESLSDVLKNVQRQISSIDFATIPIYTDALIMTLSEIVDMVDAPSVENKDPDKATILFAQEDLRLMLKVPTERYHAQLQDTCYPEFANITSV
jgi:hypothetical protein